MCVCGGEGGGGGGGRSSGTLPYIGRCGVRRSVIFHETTHQQEVIKDLKLKSGVNVNVIEYHSPRTRKQSTVHRGLVQHNVASENQGPVVQSVVSLTSSLRVISLTVLTDLIYNILIFFAEKMSTHIFSAKNFSIFAYHSI